MIMKQYIRFIIFLITPLMCVMCTRNAGNFLASLEKDRISCPDSVRVAMVDKSDIYGESSSSESDYVPLFNYLVEHNDNKYDGNIGCNLYRMFSGFPSKQSEFEGYLELLPSDKQRAAVATLTSLLIEAFIPESDIAGIADSKIVENLFFEKFPFLSKYEASRELLTKLPFIQTYETDNFLSDLEKDRISCSDSERINKVYKSDIYKESSSSASAYIPLFNYLIEHTEKRYDGSIGYDLYKMFSKFPSKQSEFDGYLELLPPDKQKAVIATMTSLMIGMFSGEPEMAGVSDIRIMKILFFAKFPFLNKYEISQKAVERSFTDYCGICANEFLKDLKKGDIAASPNDSVRIVQTPYGRKVFKDDWGSTGLLNIFSQRTGDIRVDSINTRVIIDVCGVSDGALAEMMGYYCIADITNKPYSIVQIYKASDKEVLSNYIDYIASYLCLDQQESNKSPDEFEKFAGRLYDMWHTMDDYQTLSEILDIIQSRYKYYLKNL